MPRASSGRLKLPSSSTRPAATRTGRSSRFDPIAPSTGSDREREGLPDLARLPLGGVLQRLDCPRLIEVRDGIELLWQPSLEVVAHALGFGAVDYADRPLEPRIA